MKICLKNPIPSFSEKMGKIVILRAYRPFLTCLTVYKLDNFRTSDRRILFRNICRAIGFTLTFAIFLLLFLLTEFLACYNKNFDLNVIVGPFSFFLVTSLVVPVYFVMLWKSNKIIDTLDYLDEVVVASKHFRRSYFSLLANMPAICYCKTRQTTYYPFKESIYHHNYRLTMKRSIKNMVVLL